MNVQWAKQRLTEFRDVCLRYNASTAPGEYVGDITLRDTMYRQEPTAKKILAALDPQLATFEGTEYFGGPHEAATAATRGLGILADLEEVETNLRPAAPSLSADELHPWVWQAAAAFWDAGAHLVAVEQACKSVNAHTQQKLGVVDLSDDDLMAQAWSDDPPKQGRPRLRVQGDPSSPTTKSHQAGARMLAQGCWKGIRNVAAHTVEGSERQEALEFLATLSVLARWIESANVERLAD